MLSRDALDWSFIIPIYLPILTSCSTVMTCDTAKEAWKKLHAIHEKSSASRKVTMLRAFNNSKMEPTESVIEYTTRLRQMAAALEDINEKISDATLIARILDGLPGKFDMTVEAWDNLEAEKQTVDVLEDRLLRSEQRMTSKEEATALMAISGKDGKRKPRDFGKQGNASRGQSGGQAVAQHNQEKGNIRCYFCNRPGHMKRHCRKRKRRFGANNAEGESDSANHENDPVLLIASIEQNDVHCLSADVSNDFINRFMRLNSTEIWLADSGASRHITCRKDWLTNFRPFDNSTMISGINGQVAVLGVGDVTILRLVNGEWLPGKLQDVWYVPGCGKNLLATGVCMSRGMKIIFHGQEVRIEQDDKPIAIGILQTIKFAVCLSRQLLRMIYKQMLL